MTLYTHKASMFLKNGLTGKPNRTTDPMLSKLEDRLYTMAQYITQRYGQETFDDILNSVYSK